jgi:ubiquitin-like modifier-activating enzyme 5
VSPFLGYNAFSDYFPKYPLTPNPDCSDKKCQELQKYYEAHPEERRIKPKEDKKEETTTAIS